MRPQGESRPDLVGDGYDSEPLWNAARVARELDVPEKRVYKLPIQRVRVSQRRVRWRPTDVRAFIQRRLEPAP